MADPKDSPSQLLEDLLDDISGGPNRRAHDHIGNFNFKVEIEGVTQGALKDSWETTKKIVAEGGGNDI